MFRIQHYWIKLIIYADVLYYFGRRVSMAITRPKTDWNKTHTDGDQLKRQLQLITNGVGNAVHQFCI